MLCLVLDPANTARLYIGTDLGVFASNDGGASWAVENTGFANVFTEALALQVENGVTRLYAFTHGRSAWRVTVNQTGCNYGLAQTGRSVTAAGETNSVNVTARPAQTGGCGWRTESNTAWITVNGSGSGDGAATYTVAPNTSVTPRTGTATIAERTLVIKQAGQLDQSAPVLRITNPISPTITTAQTAINLAGTLTDSGIVSAVTWTNDRGRNGVATGTNNWTMGALPLFTGVNHITVSATDAAGTAGVEG